MKFVIEKGYCNGAKIEKWSTADGKTGEKLKLLIKERTGDSEFDTVLIRELDVHVEQPTDLITMKNMYDSYKDKIVRVEGTIYSRSYNSKGKTSVFATYYVESIEIV